MAACGHWMPGLGTVAAPPCLVWFQMPLSLWMLSFISSPWGLYSPRGSTWVSPTVLWTLTSLKEKRSCHNQCIITVGNLQNTDAFFYMLFPNVLDQLLRAMPSNCLEDLFLDHKSPNVGSLFVLIKNGKIKASYRVIPCMTSLRDDKPYEGRPLSVMVTTNARHIELFNKYHFID
ncbi:uncharacterized protein AAEQ78_002049 [Lycaon pictus]